MCVLCCRKTTQKLFFDMCYTGRRIKGLIQKYGNLCNQPGEYAKECMLICPPFAQAWQCMPYPAMSHQRNRYKAQLVGGIKRLQQVRVDFVEGGVVGGVGGEAGGGKLNPAQQPHHQATGSGGNSFFGSPSR